MGYINIGIKKYKISGFGQTVFEMSAGLFKGIRLDIVDGIMNDFVDILSRAEKLLDDDKVLDAYHEKEIKDDMVNGDMNHNNHIQKMYLREKRKYFEDRYTIEELIWMVDFGYFVSEMEGRVGNEWYRLYEMVRGKLPDDFPNEISFSIMINNVCDRKINKYINQEVKNYFSQYPQAIEYLKQWKIPDNLPLYPDIGLTVEEFVKQAERLKSSNLTLMEL